MRFRRQRLKISYFHVGVVVNLLKTVGKLIISVQSVHVFIQNWRVYPD
jgi:hypothetical protein